MLSVSALLPEFFFVRLQLTVVLLAGLLVALVAL